MSAADRFRQAVEARDADAAVALLAPDVLFRSPAVHRPYHGAEAVSRLLRAVMEVLEDFRYTTQLGADEVHALIFTARVGDRELQGLDLIVEDAEGRIAELTVMVRPLSGLGALAQEMGARLAA